MPPTNPLSPTRSAANPPLTFPALTGPEEAEIVGHYRRFDASQWWPSESIRQWQFAQLSRLVEHARRNVPHYADALQGLQTGAEGLDETTWKTLPILTKAQVRAEPARFKSRYLDPRVEVHSKWTTGSTGVPLEVQTTSSYWPLFRAIKMRMLQWHGYDPRGKACEIMPLPDAKPQGPVQRLPCWEWPFGVLFKTGEQVRLDILSDIPAQVAFLEAEAPEYLLTFPSNLRPLLRAFRRAGKRLPSLRLVRTLSEQLDPDLRLECRETLGVPLVDSYGAKECGYAAIQCPEHDHYHVQSELNLIEILAEDGAPCGPGETGRVVVTPLHAFAMPLLRYDLGDYAEVGEPCPCGRGLPILRRILGRKRNLLTLPSGETGSVILSKRIFASMPAVVQYQIVQKSRSELEVRIVTERPLEKTESEQIIERLAKQVGPGFHIRLAFVDGIPRLPGGKFMDFVSEIESGG